MTKSDFTAPCKVMTQIRTLGWLLSNIHSGEFVTEDQAYGLGMYSEMIAENIQSMISKLEEKNNGGN